jgi:hypothetical protein
VGSLRASLIIFFFRCGILESAEGWTKLEPGYDQPTERADGVLAYSTSQVSSEQGRVYLFGGFDGTTKHNDIFKYEICEFLRVFFFFDRFYEGSLFYMSCLFLFFVFSTQLRISGGSCLLPLSLSV